MCSKHRRLEIDLASEENLREQANKHLMELVRKLACCLGMEVSDNLTPDCVLSKTNDVVGELQRLRSKLSATCESLTTCEAELHNMRNASNTERCNLLAQIESLKTITTGLEARCKSTERDLQLTRDRLTETDMGADKLRGEKFSFISPFSCSMLRAENNFHEVLIHYPPYFEREEHFFLFRAQCTRKLFSSVFHGEI
jgi:hypothetical protein